MRGQPDCDQTADEQKVQDKDDAQSACRSHAAYYRDLACRDASPTQAGVAPSSACVRGSLPQRRAPPLDQDETATHSRRPVGVPQVQAPTAMQGVGPWMLAGPGTLGPWTPVLGALEDGADVRDRRTSTSG